MTMGFAHDTLGQRVLFGAAQAAANVEAECARLGAERVMVVHGRGGADLAGGLSDRIPVRLTWPDVAQHVPAATAGAARGMAIRTGVDLVVAIGGGSAIGLAKAITLDHPLPVIAVPTTFAGSEATNVWGVTEGGRKTTGVDNRVLPATVVYDACLTLTLPREVVVTSGLNALAHCVDSLWAPHADPINAALAQEGARTLAGGLRSATTDPADLATREIMQYGAYLAAVAFASAGSGLHHKICHVLGGAYGLPHAATHAVVPPYVAALNLPVAANARRRLETAWGVDDALAGLVRLRDDLSAPRSLAELGLDHDEVPEAVRLIMERVPAGNPRPLDEATMSDLVEATWSGTDPGDLTF